MQLWVVEGELDIPVCLRSPDNALLTHFCLNLGGDNPDGFVQMRHLDQERASNSVFWSQSEPIIYKCRALVSASEAPLALMRGMELYEHVADRLTLMTGYPLRVLSVGYTYNEEELKDCIAGKASEYSMTTGGEETFRTQPPKNGQQQHQRLLLPPKTALEALRWFRHGMTATRRVDQYLYYYIALESIAKHIPGVTRSPRHNNVGEVEEACPTCGTGGELETQENAAIKYLISRHPNLPAGAKNTLARIRARIAHGNTDIQTLELARKNLNAVQRLAADGIALVYGIDPTKFHVLAPSPIEFMAPLGKALYSVEENPVKSWGSLLSDVFTDYLEKAKILQASS